MNPVQRWSSLGMGILLSLIGMPQAQALPGQTVEEVTAWIQAHPTLQPAPGETLLIRKSDTPARRFTFQASITPPGRASQGTSGLIRSEQLSLFDVINGVSRDRLEEALRVIYGVAIYQDYQQATPVYSYPTLQTLNHAQNRDTPLLAAIQGEVRAGDRYAYWLEITQSPQGMAYTGRITVFLKEDLDRFTTELENR